MDAPSLSNSEDAAVPVPLFESSRGLRRAGPGREAPEQLLQCSVCFELVTCALSQNYGLGVGKLGFGCQHFGFPAASCLAGKSTDPEAMQAPEMQKGASIFPWGFYSA